MEHRFVFFDMAIQHVTRAARVFRQPGKHMHMVGVGGTGKATVAKLAAFIEDGVFLRPFVSRTYNLLEFRDDLKKASMQAGVKGDNTVLFLTDNLVKVSSNNDNLLFVLLYIVVIGLFIGKEPAVNSGNQRNLQIIH